MLTDFNKFSKVTRERKHNSFQCGNDGNSCEKGKAMNHYPKLQTQHLKHPEVMVLDTNLELRVSSIGQRNQRGKPQQHPGR